MGHQLLKNKAIPLVLMTGIAFSAPPVASEQDYLVYLVDMPIVLTASRLRQTQADAPQAVTIIGREMIVASGAREIADLLRLVPGFHVSYVTYLNGYHPLASHHGMTREYTSPLQVLVDGRSINNHSLGVADLAAQTGVEGQVVWRPASGTLMLLNFAHLRTESSNLRAATSFQLGTHKGEIALVVENVGDVRYTEFRRDTIAQRRV
jgi:outer membrane receptor for ferrienterochelin and colicin